MKIAEAARHSMRCLEAVYSHDACASAGKGTQPNQQTWLRRMLGVDTRERAPEGTAGESEDERRGSDLCTDKLLSKIRKCLFGVVTAEQREGVEDGAWPNLHNPLKALLRAVAVASAHLHAPTQHEHALVEEHLVINKNGALVL